mgnify:CR=1 FL=1
MKLKQTRENETGRLVWFVQIDSGTDSTCSDNLKQWFLTFLKTGNNTFDYMKNSRNTKINEIQKNKQKHAAWK